jgi:hypothetical protein
LTEVVKKENKTVKELLKDISNCGLVGREHSKCETNERSTESGCATAQRNIHWSPKSLLKKLEPECGAVRFHACIWHVLQFVLKDSFGQSLLLKALDDAILEMIAACNISEVVQVAKSHCPVHVVTRWFSRDSSLSWLLQHEQIPTRLDLSHLNARDRRKIVKAMTADNFAKLKMLRSVTSPFTKCVCFFERDNISISIYCPYWPPSSSFST